MNRTVITAFLLAGIAVYAFVPAIQAQTPEGAIRLQDVDTNKDGKISHEESHAYILRLEQAHDFEEQKARNADKLKREAEHAAPASMPAAMAPVKPAARPLPLPVAAKKDLPKAMLLTVEGAPANDQKKLDKRLREMKALDANNDGILQAVELQRSAAKKFDSADTNNDGNISAAEMVAAKDQFSAQQEVSYGKAAARQEAIRVGNHLKNADENRDGLVSKNEYETFMNARQSLFDRDHDGIVTEAEYRTDGEKIPSSYRQDRRDR